MFVLRKIFGNGIENNFFLGNSYQVLLRENNTIEFNDFKDKVFGRNNDDSECYGFVIGDDIRNPQILWVNQRNYIMSDNGNTFANLTLRS